MGLNYVKNKNNRMYFIEIDGLRIVSVVCTRLNITLQQYVETLEMCGGKYSPMYGWFLPDEESAMKCVVALSLL